MSEESRIKILSERYLDGMASEEETQELDKLLQSSKEARHEFLEKSHFHSLLDESYDTVNDSEPGAAANSRPLLFPRPIAQWLVVAASIALAFLLGNQFPGTSDNRPDSHIGDTPQYVAQLTHFSGVMDKSLRLGQYLEQGKVLEIEEGLLELTFFDGTVVTLQAPAKAGLSGLHQVDVLEGLLTVQVPKWVEGFHVKTANSWITNNASTYGIKAFENGTLETHVIQGSIRIDGLDGKSLAQLSKSQAFRVTDSKAEAIPYQAGLFPRMRGSSDNLVPSGDFEPGVVVHSDKLPGSFHQWSGDFARIVKAEQGITPANGRGMLRFLHTYNSDSPEGSENRNSSSQVLHMLDLRDSFPEGIQAGSKIRVTCQVNRVDAGAETDNRFNVRLMALGSLPEDIFSYESLPYATISKTLDSDSSPETWERLSVEMEILPTAPIIFIEIAALENVHNDIGGNVELHGHYMDGLRVNITNPPSPAPILVTSL